MVDLEVSLYSFLLPGVRLCVCVSFFLSIFSSCLFFRRYTHGFNVCCGNIKIACFQRQPILVNTVDIGGENVNMECLQIAIYNNEENNQDGSWKITSAQLLINLRDG